MVSLKSGPIPITRSVVCLIIIGAFLRLIHFDLMEFSIDGVTAILTTQFWLSRGIPQYGLMSGAGVMMPPGLIYLLYPLLLVTDSPLWICFYIACLNIAALWLIYRLGTEIDSPRAGFWACGIMATHPWLIIYSRKIWPQCFLPFFVILFLIVICHCTRHPKSRRIFWAGPLVSLIWQIHYSGYTILAFFVIWFSVSAGQRRIRWPSALGGFLLGLLLFFPHLVFLIHARFSPLRKALESGMGVEIPILRNIPLLLKMFGETSFAGGFGFFFRGSQYRTISLARTPLGAESPWLIPLVLISTGLLLIFFLLGIFLRRPGYEESEGFRPITHNPVNWLVFLAVLPLFLYPWRGVMVPPWYFIISLPATVTVAGLGIAKVARFRRGKGGIKYKVAAFAPGALMLISGGVIWLSFLGYLNRTGGTPGLYGLTYRVQKVAAEKLLKERVALDRIDVSLTRSQSFGIYYMYHFLEKQSPRMIIYSERSARLIDSLRSPGAFCAFGEKMISSPDLGPLTICLSPAGDED